MAAPADGSQAHINSPFVGREPELAQLKAAFDGAVAGAGALVAVLGEPGIGKSSLCEQLVRYVGSRGGRALVGYCYEEGSRSLPYLPFIQALTSYVLDREVEALRSELGPGISDLAHIIPAISERMAVEQRTPRDPQDDLWRLQEATTNFVRNAATSQPLLLVLEDLHDADRATLDLLVHLSRTIQTARLLVLATYRQVDVDRIHPLSAALAELRRTAQFQRVPLRGLMVQEVRGLLSVYGLGPVAVDLAEAVHRQTEGNPLFVQEVARYLAEEGLAARGAGGAFSWSASVQAILSSIPEGLRDVIGKRLSRLSTQTNQVLSVAAVIGREFRLDVLQQLVPLSGEHFEAALQEAVAAAVIEEYSSVGAVVIYRFCHAFFRQTLYEELIAPRRIRLHQQVARALTAAYSRRLEDHAAELAEHFAFSSEPADLARAVSYGHQAARQAMNVYAYNEAVRLLERALQVQAELDPDDALTRCDLLLALAEALLPTDEALRVSDRVAADAFALAEANQDHPRAVRAAMQALDAMYRASDIGGSQFGQWVIRADAHAAEGTAERVYADCYLGLNALAGGKTTEGGVHLRRAVARAAELGDDVVSVVAGRFAMAFLLSLRDREFAEHLAIEFQARPHAGIRTEVLATSLQSAAALLMGRGERELAEHAWNELVELSEQSGDQTVHVMAFNVRATRAFIDGRLEEAAEFSEALQAFAAVRRVGAVVGARGGGMHRAHFYLGRLTDADLSDRGPQTQRTFMLTRALILSYLGRCDEAREVRGRFGSVEASDDESGIFVLAGLLEVSIRCHDSATTEALLSRLSPLAGRLQAWYTIVSFGRLLGEAAAMLGRLEEAQSHYQRALDLCRRVRFRPEIALLHLDVAELLSDNYPDKRAEALEHIRFAATEFHDMHMQPSLDRAIKLAERLAPTPLETQTLAFAGLTEHATQQQSSDTLTAREREVAGLIAGGLSNRDIAAAMVITEGTVEVHVKHILSKLEFRSRSQVAVWASERGLTRPPNKL
jgi:predicted ATPase/DNA-binding CsgD family transcriptional regulator